LVDAPLPPAALLSTGRKTLLLMERREAPSIAELSQPELRLAGWRINPATNGPSRALTYSALRLKPVGEGPEVRVTGLPDGAAIADCQWSRDARHIAVTVNRANGIELWLVDATTAQARRLTGPILNGATGTEPCVWLNDSTLVIRRIPEGRGAAPIAPTVPAGPVVQENRGTRTASRTYEDMLQNAHDEALFEHYVKSELATVSIDGAIERIAPAALHTRVAPSPDGRYLLVDKLHRPYSHLVPATRFPTQIVVLERGRQVYQVADLPLSENTTSGVRAGPRGVQWRADAPATLSWTTALPARGEAKDQKRDAWLMLAAPFTGKPVEQHRFEYYVQSVTWGDDSLALVTESWQRTRTQRTWRVAPGDAKQAPQLLSERSSLDRYSDPGRPALTRNAYGRMVLQRSADGSKLYFYGAGASPEGDRPMLDEFDLATRKSRRLWRSAPPHYEEFVAFLDAGLTTLLTRRESIEEPGGYCIRSLADGRVTPITNSPNPYAGLAGVKGELIRYQRADGTALSGTLYLPPGYKPEQGPLPTLIWAYPREHLSADTAEQVNAAPEKFTRISVNGPLPFLLAGYAVLNDPTMPIIGRNGAQPNDTYIEQLVASAKAAVDELVRRGVTDPKRVAIAGHSYGAFMTANLLAHSTLFRAGIARSGAYNRTLTPFGFQSETRNFWQAPAVYAAMSPFNHADKIKAPLLLIHGEADDNAGTFPVQSERFYAALKGHGATTRFVLLPHEAHGYRARESLLHMLWEMETWLDRHVKASAPMAPKP
jgi:dipeptidyl aminopeptidase/acylaminoacyl peptidase